MATKYFKSAALMAGPLLFILIKIMPLEGLSEQGHAVLACTAWTALWWITEPVELAVTSLLPIVIFPLSGALTIAETTSSYGNPIIYLYLGGFVIGLAIEEWKLHKRIAFNIIRRIGTDEKRVILGIMIATGFLSMWISNTATAIMMLPIGISVIDQFSGRQPFSKNLMLGIAYASSIGGMATLIGTPPNIIFVGVVKDSLGIDISFFHWMLFATPFSAILLLLTWLYLTRYKTGKKNTGSIVIEHPGKMSVAEKRVAFIFVLTAFFWITRTFLWSRLIPAIDDTIIAITGGLLMFIVPSGTEKRRLMNWEAARKIPWGVLILFGAGLAIAKGFSTTDLTVWLGEHFSRLNFLPAAIIMLIIFASINFLTELTSNTATASMLLPILITLGMSLNIDTLPLLAGAAISASCAFMLPVATPPNAIVFGSGKLTIRDMMRTGILLNIMSIILAFLFVEFLWPYIFG